MANHRILKRDPEWWREDGELSEEQKEKRMSEEVSSPKSLKEAKVTLKLVEKPSKPYEGPKAGSDGKNVPSVTTMYARKKASEAIKPVAKRVVEADEADEDEIEDEEISDDDLISDNEYEDDMNPESDVAPEFEDEGEGDVEIGQSTCRCPACGATLILEPVEEDEDEELAVAEDDLEDESEVEGEEGEVPLDMDVESEDQDIEKAKLESSRRRIFKKYIEARKNFRSLEKALKEMDDSDQDIDPEMAFDNGIDSEYVESAKKKRQMELVRKRILARKRKAEGNSELGVPFGSESADMVTPGKTPSGTKTIDDGNTDDFGDLGTDKSFANSSSPVMERRKALKKKIEQHRRKVSEEGVVDPYELEDTEQKQIGDEFADLPIEVGNDPDAISQYESIRQRRKNRQKEGIETEEKLDFKKLISK